VTDAVLYGSKSLNCHTLDTLSDFMYTVEMKRRTLEIKHLKKKDVETAAKRSRSFIFL